METQRGGSSQEGSGGPDPPATHTEACGGPDPPAPHTEACGGPDPPDTHTEACGGPDPPATHTEACGGPDSPATHTEACGGPDPPAPHTEACGGLDPPDTHTLRLSGGSGVLMDSGSPTEHHAENPGMKTDILNGETGAVGCSSDPRALRTPPDGSPNPPDGSPNPPDGSPNPPDGSPNPPDGSPNPPDGSPNPPDGSPNPPDGSPNPPDGSPNPPDGSPNPPDGSPNPPDGSPNPPDGSPNPPDGSPNPPDGSPNPPDGSPNPPDGSPNPPDGSPNPPDGSPNPPDGSPNPPDGSPNPPDGSPNPPDGSPNPPDGSPNPPDGSPNPPDGSPNPPDGSPNPPDGSPNPPDGSPNPPDGSPNPPDGSPNPPDGSPTPRPAAEASALGLSYQPAPLGSSSLPGSVSCDPAPRLGPADRLDDDDDDGCDDDDDDNAFEPQQSHQEEEEEEGEGSACRGSRNTFRSSRRQSAPAAGGGELAQDEAPEAGEQPDLQSRRPGIAEYLGDRVCFLGDRGQEVKVLQGGSCLVKFLPERVPPKTQDHTAVVMEIRGVCFVFQEYEVRSTVDSTTQNAVGQSSRKKRPGFEPLSTTALILEDRPPNLPAKSLQEAQRHRQQYDEMVAGAKRREVKEAERRERQLKDRLKQEENISNAMLVWNKNILPCWDAMRSSSTCRDLWWSGLPPSVRGRVWSLSISNELNITPDLYEIFVSRAKEKWSFSEGAENHNEDGESSIELIQLDISTTLPSLYIFQKGGPYHDLLRSILGAYLCYRPDVGYVQGMSFLAAVLILNMEPSDSFSCFANLLNKPCQMTFYRVNHDMMLRYFGAFELFFQESLPRLFAHFQTFSLTPDLYLIEWIYSLYLRSLPLDVACRVWDVFCRDGEEFLFRTALGILRLKQHVLLNMDLIHIVQFLSRLPDEEQLSDRLFSCIAATPMLSGNRKWSQVLNRDPENS